ncbi:MAG: glycosyltransferase family 39 protein [Pirellulales bacterium]
MSTLTGRNPSERSERRFALRWLIWANVVALLAVAIFFRAWRLDHVPGINGDEAWMGVQAQRWIDGQLETLTTPTGNVLNVFHFGPQVVLHTFCKPSIGLLRLPVLISGLMALLVNYLLCSYTFGRRPAVWSSVALAVLPINIAYCRFAWDASQTVLFSLPVIYFSLLAVQRRQQPIRWLALGGLFQAFAVVVHPTNVFLVPFPASALFILAWPALVKSIFAAKSRWIWRLSWLTFALLMMGVALSIWPWVQLAGRRLVSPVHYMVFIQNFFDLLTGTTVYRYIAGAPGGTGVFSTFGLTLFVGVLTVVAGYGLWQYGWDRVEQRLLAVGTIATVWMFFLFAGPMAIAAGNERYGICLIAPGSLFVAFGLYWYSMQRPAVTSLAGIAAGWLLVFGFYTNYFQFIDRTGGEAHFAFRTGQIEPKQAIAHYLLGEAGHCDSVVAVATEWWSYWPLAYLTHHDQNVHVVACPDGDARFGQAPGLPAAVPYLEGAALQLLRRQGTEIRFVEFSETGRASEVEQRLLSAGIETNSTAVYDELQRPVITVVWPRARAF